MGKVKQAFGETVGNEKLTNQGVADCEFRNSDLPNSGNSGTPNKDHAKGVAKETWGNAKEAASEVHQSHEDAATDKAHERRNKISPSVQNTREKVKEKIDEFKDRHSA